MDDTLTFDDTIAALASAPGPAARGIVRVSGTNVRGLLAPVFLPDDLSSWETEQMARRHPGSFTVEGLHLPLRVDVLLWPTDRSYTGEPLAEIHTIGSPPLLDGILTALFDQGARPARRGEFTLRAFLAGRIDLLQAEAVLGVIDATDQQQLNTALSQLGGGLSGQVAELHEELLLHLADLEAGLDFVEEDIEFVSRDELRRRLDEGSAFLQRLLEQSEQRLQSTGRKLVVLAGLPNAGKSTLFNALAMEDLALVSPESGTTRDYLSVCLDWDGLAIELVDTAGWVERSADLTQLADHQRQKQWERADLILWCVPRGMTAIERNQSRQLQFEMLSTGVSWIGITTKGDNGPPAADDATIVVTAPTRSGLAELRQGIIQELQLPGGTDEVLGSTVARCRDSMVSAKSSLQRASDAARNGLGDELIAFELHTAVDQLGKIAGKVYTDDVLDRIFSRFCIGK